MAVALRVSGFHSMLHLKRGSSLAFLNNMLALKRRGHDVHAYSFLLDDWYRSAFEEAGIPATSLGHHQRELMGVHLILTNNTRARGVFRRLRDEFRGSDVAYLHGNQWTPLALPILDMPRAYYCDEPPRHYYEPDLVNVTARKRVGKAIGSLSRALDKRADRRAVVHADAVATNSDYTRGYIKRVYGIEATTVYLGVDHEVFSPDPAVDRENMVLSVGALYPLKGHDFIIRSLARIEPELRPRLVMVGGGAQQEELEELARTSGVRVEVVTEIDTPRLAGLYRRARLTVVAHVREPFGLVAIESQSCGTPVVAVGEAGLLETVRPETGILTSRDETEFSAAVSKLLKDDEGRHEMGLKGREWVKEVYDWDRTGAGMGKVLERSVTAFGRKEGA